MTEYDKSFCTYSTEIFTGLCVFFLLSIVEMILIFIMFFKPKREKSDKNQKSVDEQWRKNENDDYDGYMKPSECIAAEYVELSLNKLNSSAGVY